ncbi:hypothetical protein TRFO_20278 [Tritrichomonas foetus]|uniref:Protein kinase domain-containing protein n=1 Tax=Tritrichomonas foetus TaxID=1144522 RepID=A0A1J4KM63_9EUKA|nr:hypothetical protein TRFO_20278 [Tritrichomonas foetus]|eukprot:OHT10461.1 hypothetical protein TRFO_20278 [Tritrichomonas foetus]
MMTFYGFLQRMSIFNFSNARMQNNIDKNNFSIKIFDEMKVEVEFGSNYNKKIFDCSTTNDAKLLVFLVKAFLSINGRINKSQFRKITTLFESYYTPNDNSSINHDEKLNDRCLGKVYLVEYESEIFALRSVPKDVLRPGYCDIPSSLVIPSHPNVAGIKFSFASHSKLYIVSDYPSFGELNVDSEKFQLNIAQVASAIDFCHLNGLSFNNLHPENILIDVNGNAIITQFGSFTNSPMRESVTESNKIRKMKDWKSLGVIVKKVTMRCMPSSSFSFDYDQNYYNFDINQDGFANNYINHQNEQENFGNYEFFFDCTFLNDVFEHESHQKASKIIQSLVDVLCSPQNIGSRAKKERRFDEIKTHHFFKGIKWIPCPERRCIIPTAKEPNPPLNQKSNCNERNNCLNEPPVENSLESSLEYFFGSEIERWMLDCQEI